MKNNLYWSFNLPLQIWPVREGESNDDVAEDAGPITDYRVLNYMPRKEHCTWLHLSELLTEQTREEFLESAALYFENLAKQFREAAKDPNKYVYYHNEGMTK